MVHTVVDGTFRQTDLTNDSPEYPAKREELRLANNRLRTPFAFLYEFFAEPIYSFAADANA